MESEAEEYIEYGLSFNIYVHACTGVYITLARVSKCARVIEIT